MKKHRRRWTKNWLEWNSTIFFIWWILYDCTMCVESRHAKMNEPRHNYLEYRTLASILRKSNSHFCTSLCCAVTYEIKNLLLFGFDAINLLQWLCEKSYNGDFFSSHINRVWLSSSLVIDLKPVQQWSIVCIHLLDISQVPFMFLCSSWVCLFFHIFFLHSRLAAWSTLSSF